MNKGEPRSSVPEIREFRSSWLSWGACNHRGSTGVRGQLCQVLHHLIIQLAGPCHNVIELKFLLPPHYHDFKTGIKVHKLCWDLYLPAFSCLGKSNAGRHLAPHCGLCCNPICYSLTSDTYIAPAPTSKSIRGGCWGE